MGKIDRRVLRTRQLLRDALMALILEKGFAGLTVQEIAERANVGRATFYLHYGDKEELLYKSLEAVFDELVAAMGPPTADQVLTGEPVRVVFNHAAQNSDLYRVILRGHGSAHVFQQIRDYMATEVKRRLLPLLPEKRPFSDALLANYLGGSLLSLVAWWLDADMPHTPEEMTTIYRQLIFFGLSSLAEG